MADLASPNHTVAERLNTEESEASQILGMVSIGTVADDFRQLVKAVEQNREQAKEVFAHAERDGATDLIKVDGWQLYSPWRRSLFASENRDAHKILDSNGTGAKTHRSFLGEINQS